MQVNGRVEGSVSCAGTVTIGSEGVVKGEITCEFLVLYGQVEGLVRAQHVTLKNTGQLTGIIHSVQLVIEPGGKFFGTNESLAVSAVVVPQLFVVEAAPPISTACASGESDLGISCEKTG